MTEEQNKLADELEIEVASSRRVSRGWVAVPLDRADEIIAALREPATDAVLVEALRKAADTFRDLNIVLKVLDRPMSARACEIAEEGCRAALKGKGASQDEDAKR